MLHVTLLQYKGENFAAFIYFIVFFSRFGKNKVKWKDYLILYKDGEWLVVKLSMLGRRNATGHCQHYICHLINNKK